MCAQSTVLNTLKSYVSYGAIGFLPTFVFLSLPQGHYLATPSADLIITEHRRYIKKRGKCMRVLRVAYKLLRMFFCSVYFYFFPITAIVLPGVATVVLR